MAQKTYSIKMTFTELLLGTVPKDKEIYKKFIASKAPAEVDTEEEVQTVEEMEIEGWTGFHLDAESGQPFLYDYVIKGFFKEACSMLRRVAGTESSKLTAYKKVVDGLVFPRPRQIDIDLNGGEIRIFERPMRGQTPKGERVFLVRSDACPIGTTIEFEVMILGGVSKKLLIEWLDYGILHGIGQWRNGGYGAFQYKLEEIKA